MFGLKPARRWQPAFYPFRKEMVGRRLLARIELLIKGPVFGCRMCGNCLLQETAFICPMECPKGLRNGPCGGVTPEKKCYVDDTRKCIWDCIYRRAKYTGRENRLLEVLPPLDWARAGTDTWGDVVRQVRKVGTSRFLWGIIARDKEERSRVWDSVFLSVRQPGWWKGDSEYHPATCGGPVSELEKRLREGKFIVATEVTPPLGADPQRLIRDIGLVIPFVNVINFTDSSSAIPRMSAISCCKTAVDLRAEPIFQIAARDTTRTGLQSAAIGAVQLGIKNMLCVTGDNPTAGLSPKSNMNLLDIDSVQMLWMLRRMRDEGLYLDGRRMKNPPRYFLGAATSPFSFGSRASGYQGPEKGQCRSSVLSDKHYF